MYDKNGKPVGVLSHELKTHVSDSYESDYMTTMNKDFYKMKIDDRSSNEEIFAYSAQVTNKQNLLKDSLETAEGVKKANDVDNQNKGTISSLPITSDTGLMD